jgi:hypothetical protein
MEGHTLYLFSRSSIRCRLVVRDMELTAIMLTGAAVIVLSQTCRPISEISTAAGRDVDRSWGKAECEKRPGLGQRDKMC